MSTFPAHRAVSIEYVGGPLDGQARLYDCQWLQVELRLPRLRGMSCAELTPLSESARYEVIEGVYRLQRWHDGTRIYRWMGDRVT